MTPVSAAGSYNPAPAPPQYSAQSGGQDDQNYDQGYDDSGQQTIEATQAPPPLPEYTQPPCPGDNYLWTPGYWSYASQGYYWVPGAWVVAPYVDALWTPPYWGFYGGRYRWHSGYWGNYIGFYGGVNYGFGYGGRGYDGGYWRNSQFNYNSAVTNVNVSVVHNNVYNYRVAGGSSRVSYNGGPGGLNVRATAPEVAAMHGQRMAPIAAQVQHERQAQGNRAQFAAVNGGRPAQPALAHPIATSYNAPAARPSEVQGHPRLIAPAPRTEQRTAAPALRAQAQSGPPEARPAEAFRPAPQAAHQEAQRPQMAQQARPAEQQRPQMAQQQARPETQRPQMAQQARPAEQQRPQMAQQQTRPAEAQRPQSAPQQARPAPAPRAEAPRQAAPPRAEAPRQAPPQQAHPAPAQRAEPPKNEKHDK
jgi:hypothetical protein